MLERGAFGLLVWCSMQLVSHTVRAAHGETDAAALAGQSDPRQYAVALGASLSVGDPGWGTELGNSVQVYGRYQLYRGLGVGASYFWLSAPNNEGGWWLEFHAQALEGFAEYHPFEVSWFDPFLRVGVLGLTHTEGIEDADRVGLQGVLGIDFVLPHFAIGPHVRSGLTNRTWNMLGLHTELRF